MLTPTIIFAMAKSIARNIARKPGDENNSSKVVGCIE
jgi:hypothetical protein